ncbi:MAG TPA: CbiQ family ECF transporter T component [Acidimicrobiales bacterium]|nr:CbiQ family ECF transporter T component [Acidimicrobiales bacterium]
MSSAHSAERAAARLRSPVSSLAPEAKVVGLVAFLVAVAVTPPSRPWALALDGAVAVAVAVAALVEWRAVAGRLSLDLPLVVLAGAYALAGRGPHVEVLGLSLSEPGLRAGLGVLAKATVGIVAVSVLAASSSVPEIVDGLRRVGAPPWFRRLVVLAARQLQVLRAEFTRLRLAVAVRTGSPRRAVALASGARSLGSLFVRSTERADRLQLAAELRGAPAGSPPAAPAAATAAAGARDWLAALAPAAVAAAAVVVL